ncbi:hypothetical protein D1871_04530 [Nakamurella silvestris]|nr:hypothetical protein D1871_04530 [Nakamurella silvestris]
MIAPYDHDALWLKAKVFLNRATDQAPSRSFDEQAFWASAALELLGKAALARVSPLLIAEPTEDGLNLLIASGLVKGTAKFTSVSASTIFKRCAKAFKPFDAIEAQKFADARNEYVHGSGLSSMTIPASAWWPRFWALAMILITAQDKDLEELVGQSRANDVHAHLEQNKRNVEHRVESLMARAGQRLEQYRAGTLPAKIQAEWETNADLTAGFPYLSAQTCPVCNGQGTSEGDDGSESELQSGGDDEESWYWATVTVPVIYFACPSCRLVLDGYELIEKAGLPTEFQVEEEASPEESDYGND